MRVRHTTRVFSAPAAPLLALALVYFSVPSFMEAKSPLPLADPVKIEVTAQALQISVPGGGSAVYVALDSDPLSGSAVVPYGQGAEGSTVFLPIRADRLYFAMQREGAPLKALRLHRQTMWSGPLDVKSEFEVTEQDGVVHWHTAWNLQPVSF